MSWKNKISLSYLRECRIKEGKGEGEKKGREGIYILTVVKAMAMAKVKLFVF